MSLVERAIDDHVMTITLSDEVHRNALGDELMVELVEAIDEANELANVRVVIVTNRGSVFCAGADLRERSSSHDPAIALADLFEKIRSSPKVFVGRISGHCVAGGVGLAAVLDVSVAPDSATFGFSEVRVGVAPAIISVVCLPKMHLASAQSAFLRGNRFGAQEAARIGLITLCVSPESLDSTVRDIVNDLLAGAPDALAATKEILRTIPTLSPADGFRWATHLSSTLFARDEAREGISAFLDKRTASWVRRLGDPD
ncbi:MAG TPA: enoyl-CoA hydratase-related protein [Acidimicrobiales bacterium]|nr:enoyl-CoA hydratase-related protein [Acidimicrobiales bacterium]